MSFFKKENLELKSRFLGRVLGILQKRRDMMNIRILRIQKNLHKVLMDYFLVRSQRTYPGVISVKEIELEPDFKKAKVYISVMGTAEDAQQTRLRLEADRFHIRTLINRRLRMKYCPYLNFFVNHITLPLSKVEQTLAGLKESGQL